MSICVQLVRYGKADCYGSKVIDEQLGQVVSCEARVDPLIGEGNHGDVNSDNEPLWFQFNLLALLAYFKLNSYVGNTRFIIRDAPLIPVPEINNT